MIDPADIAMLKEHYTEIMRLFGEAYADDKRVSKLRARGLDERAVRQTLLAQETEAYARSMESKRSKREGFVTTPPELVDFINQSVKDVLKDEFGASLNDDNVEILDPFTGTGIFVTRMIELGLIDPDALPDAYRRRMKAFEISPLNALVALRAISEAYREATGEETAPDFPGLQVVDTFTLDPETLKPHDDEKLI